MESSARERYAWGMAHEVIRLLGPLSLQSLFATN
jgi:hypothetical protein